MNILKVILKQIFSNLSFKYRNKNEFLFLFFFLEKFLENFFKKKLKKDFQTKTCQNLTRNLHVCYCEK